MGRECSQCQAHNVEGSDHPTVRIDNVAQGISLKIRRVGEHDLHYLEAANMEEYCLIDEVNCFF
jgi:hypothetical protein